MVISRHNHQAVLFIVPTTGAVADMRVVLLGGAGFIGHHLARYLRGRAQTLVVTRRLPDEEHRVEGVAYVEGDCATPGLLGQVIHPGDHVVHLAHHAVPAHSFDVPLVEVQDNLPSAIKLLEALKNIDIRRLVYVSSGGTVYGPAGAGVPIREDHATDPISPYGITKLTIEKYCGMYARLFGIPVVVARPSNPFGPGQLPHRGQGFVATAAAQVLHGETVTVFGEHGTVRDYLYIDDLVTALDCLLFADCPPGDVCNIGSAMGRTNTDVLTSIARAVGKDLSLLAVEHAPARPFDVPYNVLDTGKLNSMGWQPRTGFDEGVSRTVAWLRTQA